MSLINLKVIETHKVLFKGKANQVTLPTATGEITVLADHIPLISVIVEGRIKILDFNNNEFILENISGGVLDVRKDGEVVLLVTLK